MVALDTGSLSAQPAGVLLPAGTSWGLGTSLGLGKLKE